MFQILFTSLLLKALLILAFVLLGYLHFYCKKNESISVFIINMMPLQYYFDLVACGINN